MAAQSAGSIRGIFDLPGKLAGGAGIQQGVALIWGADEFTALIAATANAGLALGPCIEQGALPNGTASSVAPIDKVTPQLAGLAAVLVPSGTALTLGAQAVNNASGLFVPRTQYGTSAFVWGEFAQLRTTGSSSELCEMLVRPYWVEVVRQVTGGAVGAITAATVFATAPGQAKSATALPLYRARFAGETVRNLSASLKTAPGGADTVVVTVKKSSDNAATFVTTGVTCTISAAGKTAVDLVNVGVLAAGDLLEIELISSAGTAADGTFSFDVT